jgi:iron complex outermembrane receptor protein
MTWFFRGALLSGAAFVALAPAAALAQQSTPALARAVEPATVDEVIVTATRRSQRLQDVPMSVDVASGETLQKLNLTDVKDVQQLSPGLSLTNTGGRNNTATLRGIAFDPDQGTSPAVDLYFNEVPTDAQTMFTAMYDLEQIEVLRGPQGTLRGRTAPAGAITLRTRRPDLDRVTGYLQVTGTDRDGLNIQGAASMPLIPGKLALRASVLDDRNDLNHVRNVARGDSSRSKTKSGRLSLAFSPTENFNAVLTYQDLKAENLQYMQVIGPGAQPSLMDPTRSGPPANRRDRIAVSDGQRLYKNRTKMLTLSADWKLGGHTLSFVGGHQDSLLDQRGDNDPGNAVPGYIYQQTTISPVKVDTGELRLASDSRTFWNYSVSVFASKTRGDTTVQQNSPVFFANASPATPFPSSFGLYLPIDLDLIVGGTNKTVAIAASSSFQFTEKLRLEVGARYASIDSKQYSIQTVRSPGLPAFFIPPFVDGPVNTIDPKLGNRTRKPLTGGASLTYEFSPDVTAYASYGRSYRDGTAAVSAPPVTSLILTRPERSDAIELGLKTQWLDRRLTFNTDVFHQKFDGFLGRTTGINYDADRATGAQDGVVDAQFDFNFNGDATVNGVEAQLAGKLARGWTFSTSAAYVEAKYDNALSPCNDFNGDGKPDSVGTPRVYTPPGQPLRPVSLCATNGRIAEVPKFSLTATSEYVFDWGNLQPFVRSLFSYRPGFDSVQASYRYQSRELLNLYGGIRGPEGRWEISVFAKDVLNQQRVTFITQGDAVVGTTSIAGGTGAPFNSGYRLVNTSPPREFGVSATVNF